MVTGISAKDLKVRRRMPPASSTAANPQDLDDVECGILDPVPEHDGDNDKKDDDAVLSRRNADLLSDLSPLSRRIVRFVTPSHPSVSVCTSECLAVAAVQIVPYAVLLIALPLLIWDDYPEEWGLLNLYPMVRHVEMVWASLLHTSMWPIVAGTVLIAAMVPQGAMAAKYLPGKGISLSSTLATFAGQSATKTSVMLALALSNIVVGNMILQMWVPHAIWNPFIWGWYTVYLPDRIAPSLQGACLDLENHGHARQPLCLSEREWTQLSSGQLSSYNPDDVLAVQRGLDYLQHQSGGLIINTLARNVADSIPALRKNVEGLAPFFKDSHNKLSVVIFENDSNDGTREEFKAWAEEENGREEPRYDVDLMSCGSKNPDCELGLMDRYEANLLKDPKASGVGKLGEFRQIMLKYIMSEEKYKDYSHMIILDVDLGTSISPLGLLHTLGLEGDIALDHAVASQSSQVWPGTSGAIIPPYDLSAFRPKETETNEKVRTMHQSFCNLMPAGDRWRNMCEACSPMQLYMIQAASDDLSHEGRAYEVVSAFNGLTVYPMNLLRERGDGAKYDAGDDGQRCEHVGFHLSLERPMYVNPKWSMNLKPEKPGGPTGWKSIKMLIGAVLGKPNVMLTIVIGNFAFFYVMVYSVWMMAMGLRTILSLQKIELGRSSLTSI